MDYNNVNSRCTENVIVNADCNTGGIFMEASQKPNMVDTNVVWGTRGNGIYQHDCDELHRRPQLRRQERRAAPYADLPRPNRQWPFLDRRRNKILNNVFFDNSGRWRSRTGTTCGQQRLRPCSGDSV